MRKFSLSLVLIAIISGLGSAQNQPPEYNKVEIFAGYSGASLISDDEFEPVEHGFNVAAVYNFHRLFGIKVDVSGTHKKVRDNFFPPFGQPPFDPPSRYTANHSLYNASIGIQVKNNRRDDVAKPFAHLLVGYAKHTDKIKQSCPAGAVCPPFNFDFEGVSLILGVGLDIRINRRIDIRAVQLDLNPITYDSGRDRSIYANTRFSSGIVFKF